MSESTIRLTTAQAIVRWMAQQFIVVDGQEVRVFGGGFGIFGHGNVPCLGEALYEHRDQLPLYRGQNEQSMGFAAAGYAKYHLRQRMMFCTASAGPGTANLVTASALAHANRLPMLMLCGDTFLTRLPDPVLQQLENFNDPTFGVNDAFKPLTRYWDRICHPAQVIQSLPNALATMLDPADCGPAFIGLPQDVQGWAYDYPEAFFEKRVHRIRRQAVDAEQLTDAVSLLKTAQRPILIAGGGVQYSRAVQELMQLAEQLQIPVVETIAGRANLTSDHPLNIGPLGVTGSNSANAIAKQADVVFAVGTRLQDFTTGSWTAFDKSAKLLTLNVGRHDASKHGAVAMGVVNELCDAGDRVVAAAGGLPAEVCANWRTLKPGTVDIEFGFSCMGYEISGAWGARIAQTEQEASQDTIVFIGDGSYLMMNSDIYSSVLSEKKLIICVLDNGGFAVINKLQNNTGNESFNNLLSDCPTIAKPIAMNFEQHAAAMGAHAETVANPAELAEAFKQAKARPQTSVIVMAVDAFEGWTGEGHTWWEVGTPQVSARKEVRDAHEEWEATRVEQRQGG